MIQGNYIDFGDGGQIYNDNNNLLIKDNDIRLDSSKLTLLGDKIFSSSDQQVIELDDNDAIFSNNIEIEGTDIKFNKGCSLSNSQMNKLDVLVDNVQLSGDIYIGGNTIIFENGVVIENSNEDTFVINGPGEIINGVNNPGETRINNSNVRINENLRVVKELTIDSNIINSNSDKAITLDDEDVIIEGNLTVNGNRIYSNNSTAGTILLSNENVTIEGTLDIKGNTIDLRNSGTITNYQSDEVTITATAGTITSNDLYIGDNLHINGNKIYSELGSTNGAHAISLDNQSVTMENSLTVKGDTTLGDNDYYNIHLIGRVYERIQMHNGGDTPEGAVILNTPNKLSITEDTIELEGNTIFGTSDTNSTIINGALNVSGTVTCSGFSFQQGKSTKVDFNVNTLVEIEKLILSQNETIKELKQRITDLEKKIN